MPSPKQLTAVLAGSTALAGFTPTLALPVLAHIATQQHVSTSTATWVLTASFLASAVSTPILGRFADIFGGRRILLATLAMVLIGSVIAATTLNFAFLIFGRVLQGTAATLYPLAVSTIQHHIHGRRMTRAVTVVSGALGTGGVLGLVVSGLIGSGADYRVVFWFPVGLAGAAMIAVSLRVPRPTGRVSGSVDLGGCALLSAGLVLLLLPLSRGAKWGFGSPAVLGCFGASAVLLVVFVQVERRVAHPMVPLPLLRHRPLLITNVISILVGFISFVPLIALPILVQADPSIIGDGRPASPLTTSLLYLLPGSALGVLGAPLGNRLLLRYGPRGAVIGVGLIAAGGCALFAAAPAAPAALIIGLTLTTISLYVVYAALPHLVVPNVERRDLGVANGVNSLGRWIGSALVTALMSVVLVTGSHGEPISERHFRYGFLFGVAAAAATGVIAWFGLRPARVRSVAVEATIPALAGPSALADVGTVPEPAAVRARGTC